MRAMPPRRPSRTSRSAPSLRSASPTSEHCATRVTSPIYRFRLRGFEPPGVRRSRQGEAGQLPAWETDLEGRRRRAVAMRGDGARAAGAGGLVRAVQHMPPRAHWPRRRAQEAAAQRLQAQPEHK